MPRKPKARPRRLTLGPGSRAPAAPSPIPTGARAPRSRAQQTFYQCLTCGGLVDPMYGSGDESWCPHCRATGEICTMDGRIPMPDLYGAWLTKQQQAADRQRTEQETEYWLNSLPKIEGDPTMKRKKTHTGAFHCPTCFIELELIGEESLKCDQCGGPLAKGSLAEVWADEEEPGDEEE